MPRSDFGLFIHYNITCQSALRGAVHIFRNRISPHFGFYNYYRELERNNIKNCSELINTILLAFVLERHLACGNYVFWLVGSRWHSHLFI